MNTIADVLHRMVHRLPWALAVAAFTVSGICWVAVALASLGALS